MFEAKDNKANEFLSEFDIKTMPNQVDVDLRRLFDRDITDHSFYTYKGSETLPPCEENVRWVIMRQVQPMSKEQQLGFMDLWVNNATYGVSNDR